MKHKRINEFVNVNDTNVDIKLIKWFANDFESTDGEWELDFEGLKRYSAKCYDLKQYYFLENKFKKIMDYLNETKFDLQGDVFPIIEEELGITNLKDVRINVFK